MWTSNWASINSMSMKSIRTSVVKADADKQVLELLVKACPAGLYKKQDDGSVRFDYAGCLECGTCRILGLGSALEQWEYPRGTFGVEFRYG